MKNTKMIVTTYEANKSAQHSVAVGVLGFAFGLMLAGIITGPVGLFTAKKAEIGGSPTPLGMVLGWFNTCFFLFMSIFVVSSLFDTIFKDPSGILGFVSGLISISVVAVAGYYLIKVLRKKLKDMESLVEPQSETAPDKSYNQSSGLDLPVIQDLLPEEKGAARWNLRDES